jgi:hypothetical protein
MRSSYAGSCRSEHSWSKGTVRPGWGAARTVWGGLALAWRRWPLPMGDKWGLQGLHVCGLAADAEVLALLTSLHLSGNSIEDEGTTALASSAHLSNLAYHHLSNEVFLRKQKSRRCATASIAPRRAPVTLAGERNLTREQGPTMRRARSLTREVCECNIFCSRTCSPAGMTVRLVPLPPPMHDRLFASLTLPVSPPFDARRNLLLTVECVLKEPRCAALPTSTTA